MSAMPDILNDRAVDEIEARANAATPLSDDGSTIRVIYDHGGGRMWVQRNAERDLILDSYKQGDSEFYFHAREDVGALCQTIRAAWANEARLAKEVVDLRELLAYRAVELEREGRETQKWNNRANQLAIEGQGLRDQLAAVTQEHDRLKRQLADTETIRAGLKQLAGEYENEISNLKQERDALREQLKEKQ